MTRLLRRGGHRYLLYTHQLASVLGAVFVIVLVLSKLGWWSYVEWSEPNGPSSEITM
jgi:hypothetical protein